jgi:hypothetical protein
MFMLDLGSGPIIPAVSTLIQKYGKQESRKESFLYVVGSDVDGYSLA